MINNTLNLSWALSTITKFAPENAFAKAHQACPWQKIPSMKRILRLSRNHVFQLKMHRIKSTGIIIIIGN